MPQFQDYFGQAALRPQADVPRSLDQLYDLYLRRKQAKAQEAQTAQAGNLFALEQGFNPNQVTPENIAQAQGPANMVESPAIAAMRDYIARKKGGRDLEKQKTEAEIEKLKAQASGQHEGMDDGAPFRTDPETGIMYRIKPGHKGSEEIPLPGQAIGPDGKVVFTSGRAPDGKMLPPANVMAMNEGKTVSRMLPDVERAIASNQDLFGPIAGRIGAANPYDARSQKVQAQMKVASQAFGRFMEGGVLRKEDEIKYEKMFPQLGDTRDVANSKLDIVRRLLAQQYSSGRNALGASGYDVSGLGELAIPPSIFEGQKVIPESRFNALKAQGLSDDEAYKRMAQEGL